MASKFGGTPVDEPKKPQSKFGGTPVDESKSTDTKGDPRFENAQALQELAGGIFDPLLSMGSNMVLKPISDVAGLAAIHPIPQAVRKGLNYLLPGLDLPDMDPRYLQQLIQSQAYEPRTKAGASPDNPLNAIPQVIGKGINYLLPGEAEEPATITGMAQNAYRAAVPEGLALLGMKYAPATSGAVTGGMQSGARRLMRSALKPTIAAQKSGAAKTAAQTMLDYGVNVTPGGVEKLRTIIGDLNEQIAQKLQGSTGRVDKGDLLASRAMPDLQEALTSQVDPFADIEAMQRVQGNFQRHPAFSYNKATGVVDMPIQTAQKIKQGTYNVLAKKYGEMGSAETEAQKAIARSIKENIAAQEPQVALLNFEESKLIPTLDVAERRVLQQMNNNPVGLAGLAHNPGAFVLMMADKSSLFKSLLARMMNRASGVVGDAAAPIAATTTIGGPLKAISQQDQPQP